MVKTEKITRRQELMLELVTAASENNKVVVTLYAKLREQALSENDGQLRAANPLQDLENAAREAGLSWVINRAISPLGGAPDNQL